MSISIARMVSEDKAKIAIFVPRFSCQIRLLICLQDVGKNESKDQVDQTGAEAEGP